MALKVDDILDLLPEAGLTLWRFDQSPFGWHVCLEGEVAGELQHYSGDGDTPIAAIAMAFRKAGFVLEDDGT